MSVMMSSCVCIRRGAHNSVSGVLRVRALSASTAAIRSTSSSIQQASNNSQSQSVANFRPGGWDVEKYKEICTTRSIYIQHCLRIGVEDVSPGKISLRIPIPYKPAHKMDKHVSLIGLIDHAGGYSSWTLLNEGTFLSTVNMRVDFMHQNLEEVGKNTGEEPEYVYADSIVNSANDKFVRADVTCWDSKRANKIAMGRLLYGLYPSPVGNKQPPEDFDEMVARGANYNEEVYTMNIEGKRYSVQYCELMTSCCCLAFRFNG
jgi:hypothetical protein